jgi:hypothetical protein
MAEFKKPTIEEIKEYIEEKKLSVDAVWFWNYFEAGDWHDSEGKPVKSWKQKLWTHHLNKATGSGQRKKKTRLFPISGKTCSKRGCFLPAVYKYTGGEYDRYACADHLPPKVKEKFE